MRFSRPIASSLVSAALVLGPQPAQGQVLRYATEYPVLAYETAEPTNPVAELAQRLAAGELELEFDVRRGYLASLLDALGISPSSQILVFSKTSLQSAQISAATPRAIYFNEDVYLAWVPGGEGVEIAVMDPDLGPVFYTFSGDARDEPGFVRETVCLQCHDTYSLSGGGVPRFLIGSGVTSPRGQTVFHGGWNLTTDRTPLERRWGGWYVTGTHGSARHLGNLAVQNAEAAATVDLTGGSDVTALDGLVNTEPYLTDQSDIVALLVVEHQITVQNLITRANWEARTALYDNRNVGLSVDDVARRIEEVTEPLVRALFFVGEARLPSRVAGASGFQATFEATVPRDTRGRSLGELRLSERLFRYPLSYLIYSPAIAALPRPVRNRLFRRVHEVLSGVDTANDFQHVRGDVGLEILEILEATHGDFAAWMAANL